MVAIHQQQWAIQGKKGLGSLIFNENAQVPCVSDNEVLVKCEYMQIVEVLRMCNILVFND